MPPFSGASKISTCLSLLIKSQLKNPGSLGAPVRVRIDARPNYWFRCDNGCSRDRRYGRSNDVLFPGSFQTFSFNFVVYGSHNDYFPCFFLWNRASKWCCINWFFCLFIFFNNFWNWKARRNLTKKFIPGVESCYWRTRMERMHSKSLVMEHIRVD